MKRFRLYFLLLFTVGIPVQAQLPYVFTQYTTEDGLLQKTAQSILQDHKGLIWLATWDGLYKLDGYTFDRYKANPGDSTQLGSNRIYDLQEDCYGYLWMQGDDARTYRFDPRTERFNPLPYKEYMTQKLFVFPQGDTWVATRQNELIHITTHPQSHDIQAEDFFATHRLTAPGSINNIKQTADGTQWVMTANGLHSLDSDGRTASYFATYDSGHRPFHDMAEDTLSDMLYFATDKGEIVTKKRTDATFASIYLPTHAAVKLLCTVKPGETLMAATDGDGCFTINLKNGHTRHYTAATHPELKSDHTRQLHRDTHGNVWIQTNAPGVTLLERDSQRMIHLILHDKYGHPLTDESVDMRIQEDCYGQVWVASAGGGLGLWDPDSHTLRPFYNPNLQDGWNQTNRLASILADRQGNLWISSYKNGLEKVTFSRHAIGLKTMHPDEEFTGNNVRAILQDGKGRIWVGSKDRIIRLYDSSMNYIGNLTRTGRISTGSHDEIGMAYAFLQDHRGTMWIATKGNGLWAAVPDGNDNSYKLHHFSHQPGNLYSLSGNQIYALHEDKQQRLWIATFDEGINYIDLREHPTGEGHFINHRNRLRQYPTATNGRARCINTAPDGTLWIGTTNGLLMMPKPEADPEQMPFTPVRRIPGDSGSLSNNNVHNIYFSRAGQMYVCTFGGGFNLLTHLHNGIPRFRPFTTADRLTSDILLAATEDRHGNIWMATEEELCRYEPNSHQVNIFPARKLPGRIIFNEGNALTTRQGEIMFNTMMGVLHLNPDNLPTDNYIPPILLTRCLLTGIEGESRPIKGVDDIGELTLSHRQKGFSLHFAALDMKHPEGISYAYRLEGFEKQWNEVGHLRNATYTNLPPGKYTLHIKSTNSDGIWVENTRKLRINVLPSFWETPWAWFIYGLGLSLIIFLAAYILFTIFRLKHKVTMEQQISDIKLRFFTNISHELRTPLTLIAGPVEQILQSDNLDPAQRNSLTLVERNTNRMLRLVNQILDFRKIQNKKMKLRVAQTDIIPFTRHIMESFQTMADEQETDFTLNTTAESIRIWVDPDKLEKILFNLISNAFKYTPRGKAITVSISQTEEEAVISVKDQGVGISESKQKQLFVRFESLSDPTLFNPAGGSTGIGLSLVKELMDMHHGHINLQSRPGEGSTFTLSFPKGKKHLDEHTEFILQDSIVTTTDQATGEHDITPWKEEAGDLSPQADKETLLIVEDNTELRLFLHSVFLPHFNIIQAGDGEEGRQKALEFLPDIIISDVMMPRMDGMEMTRQLKREATTSHIPIVLLTAKTAIQSQVEGLESGADDYILKPFSATYLKARIFNLLEQRKKLQALYCASLMPTLQVQETEQKEENGTDTGEEMTQPSLTPADQKFMDLIMAFIDRHMDNGDLKIEEMAQKAGLSRSVFFKKVKSITGLSPNELLKEIRIKKAALLIEQGDYNMAQVAYMTGFNDSHYFSRCFKQQLGLTPSEYKAQVTLSTS
ncbi:MAG: response regulator [Bacteroides sp.]|nr:response regulator [Bacteroides sp.]